MRRSTKVFSAVLLLCFLALLNLITKRGKIKEQAVESEYQSDTLVIQPNSQQPNRELVMVIDQKEDMWKLREAVGSVHMNDIKASIKVYASMGQAEDLEEISTWKNVTVVDTGLHLFNRAGKQFKIKSPCFVYDQVKTDYTLFLPLGLAFNTATDLFQYPNDCITAEFWLQTNVVFVPEYSDSIEFRRRRRACFIEHKSEVIQVPELIRSQVSQFLTVKHEVMVADWTGRRVALLVPTFNKHNGTVFITSTFLPSLQATISEQELNDFMITLYIGYDTNDPVLEISLEDYIPHGNFAVKLHRLPSIRWATSMWNILYNDAMMDGNDYFLQVGDDVKFNDAGWLTAMTSELDGMGGVGLVGPRDTKWNCKIMTQTMVTRKHHEVFGWFYPPEIKDWFSDNWIQTTYMNLQRSRCLKAYSVTNKSNMKERYDACDNLEIANKALRKYLPKLAKYTSRL